MNTTGCTRAALIAAVAGGLAIAASTHAQVLFNVTFENGDAQGWTLQNSTIIEPSGGNPGQHLYLPLIDTFGVTLAYEVPGGALTGNLTRYGAPIAIDVDWKTFTFANFAGEPIPGKFRPLVLLVEDRPEPGSSDPPVGVFFVGVGLPDMGTEWQPRSFVIPLPPAGGGLPAGWGGYGDEDPVTFEPRLPPGRTYRSVLENADSVQITTFQPGFFYGFTFMEMGVDNIRVAVQAPACYANCDASTAQPVLNALDFACFLQRFNAGCP